MAAQLWVIGAGKGGVGKTFISSSLGITLSKLNNKVLLIDFDLTGANLHTTFGLPLTEKNLRQFFLGNSTLPQLVRPTEIPRVSYVQGYWDSWSPAAVSVDQVKNLIAECRNLDYDYVIFDMGAGTSEAYLELFKSADEKILIASPEPTCVEKTYRFIESHICYSLKEISTPDSYGKLQETLREYKMMHHKGHFSFRNYLKEASGFTFDHFETLNSKPIRLIVNSTRSRMDQDLGYSIKSVCNKYFDLAVDSVGFIDFDNAVWQSVNNREPVLIEKPFTPLAGQFLTICKQLTTPNFHSNFYRAVV